MSVTTITTSDGSFRVVAGERWRTTALVLVPLLDEWTGAIPAGVTARALTPATHAHVTAGHLVVTGLAERAMPGLAAGGVDVVVELRRPGRAPQRITVPVPMGAALPYLAPPLAVASVTIALAGRVTEAAFPHGPLVGATIAVAGVATPLLALTTPLAAPHPAGTSVQIRPLTAGAATTLAASVTRGDAVLHLSSVAGVAPGAVLAIGEDLVVADTVNGDLVTLRTPAAATAPSGVPATLQSVGTAGAAATLAREARRGDGVLLLTTALTGDVVEIVDGAATEYRRTTVRTDADGRWRLSGVRGIPEVTLTTSATGFVTDGPRTYPLAPVDPFVITTALRT